MNCQKKQEIFTLNSSIYGNIYYEIVLYYYTSLYAATCG